MLTELNFWSGASLTQSSASYVHSTLICTGLGAGRWRRGGLVPDVWLGAHVDAVGGGREGLGREGGRDPHPAASFCWRMLIFAPLAESTDALNPQTQRRRTRR